MAVTDKTTRWENIKARVRYLKRRLLYGEGDEWARALCEEIDDLELRNGERISQLENKPVVKPTMPKGRIK